MYQKKKILSYMYLFLIQVGQSPYIVQGLLINFGAYYAGESQFTHTVHVHLIYIIWTFRPFLVTFMMSRFLIIITNVISAACMLIHAHIILIIRRCT